MKCRQQPPQESLVRIFINGDFFSSLLCTPRDVKELAVGWLYNEGHIASVSDIASLAACEEQRDIHVYLANGREINKDRGGMIRTSACMGGEISNEQFLRETARVNGGPRVSLGSLKFLMKKTLTTASSYKETGGIHCAGVASATDEKPIAVFEDVGRHNALDKIVGRMLLTRQTPEDKLILTSGRISSEMALKTAHSRIPVIVSLTACTDLAVQIAEEAGLTLVGRVLGSSPVIWCGEHRIMYDNQAL